MTKMSNYVIMRYTKLWSEINPFKAMRESLSNPAHPLLVRMQASINWMYNHNAIHSYYLNMQRSNYVITTTHRSSGANGVC
jgi:hypothetical protein